MGSGAARVWGAAAAVAALIAALALPGVAVAQQITKCDASTPTFARVTAPPKYGIGPQEVVEIASALDGAAIEIAIFRPKVPAGDRVPVIVNATPYHHPQRSIDVRKCKPYYVENYVPQGYAVAFVAVRGTGESGGCMNLFGAAEGADLDQAVTWLGKRDWSTGAVGMIGKSYEGATPWEVAARGNQHLRTIVSVAGVPDVFELLYGSGNIDFRGPALLNDLYYGPSIVTYAQGRRVERTIDVAACPEYATGNAAAAHSSLTGQVDPYGYWSERRYRHLVERRYRGSVFLVQGFDDLNVPPGNQFPWIERLRRRGVPLKMWLGWWAHVNPDQTGGDARRDWPDAVLRWFDRWLRGDETLDTGPAVEVQDSVGKWRVEERWPPTRPRRRLWLGAAGELRPQPGAATATAPLMPDPVHVHPATLVPPPTPLDTICPLPTCTAFTLPGAMTPLRFAGRPMLRLRVTPAAPAGHVSAYLYAGNRRVGWGQADVRFPRGDGRPATVTPGEPLDLLMRLQPLDAVVAPGVPLVLVLSQGAAYDRIPSVPTAPLVLHTGGRASSLRLALVDR